MTVSTYCSIGGHARCTIHGCSCGCHNNGGNFMPELAQCPHCPRKMGAGAALASHIRAAHPARMQPATATHGARPAVPPPTQAGNGIVWEEPPPKRVGRRSALLDSMRPFISDLRRNPGKWARVKEYESHSGASPGRKVLAVEWPDIEFTARSRGGGSAIWARYVEPDED